MKIHHATLILFSFVLLLFPSFLSLVSLLFSVLCLFYYEIAKPFFSV